MTDKEQLTLEEFSKRMLSARLIEDAVCRDLKNDMRFWLACSVPGCEHLSCLALDSDKCFMHTPGPVWQKRLRIGWRRHGWPKWGPRLAGAWKILRGKAEAVED